MKETRVGYETAPCEVPAEPEVVTAQSIFAAYETPDTFEIILKGGERLVCRMPKDAKALADIEKKAGKLYKASQSGAPAPWKPYLPLSMEHARMIAYLDLLITPRFTHLEGLRLAKQYAPVLLHIFNEIMDKVGAAAGEAEKQATDDFLDA